MFAFHSGGRIDHSQIIWNVARLTACESYLELGLYKGSTINLVNSVVPLCVGVDIKPVNINGEFFLGTTDEFFEKNNRKFDIIFIDANHTFESAKSDFNNSLKILNPYGIIFLHDTDPMAKKYTSSNYCGDSYKLIDLILDNKDLNATTLPILEAGLTIVNRKKDRRVNAYNGSNK